MLDLDRITLCQLGKRVGIKFHLAHWPLRGGVLYDKKWEVAPKLDRDDNDSERKKNLWL